MFDISQTNSVTLRSISYLQFDNLQTLWWTLLFSKSEDRFQDEPEMIQNDHLQTRELSSFLDLTSSLACTDYFKEFNN